MRPPSTMSAGSADAKRTEPAFVVWPASTTRQCPVTYRASSLARYSAALAMSTGSPAMPRFEPARMRSVVGLDLGGVAGVREGRHARHGVAGGDRVHAHAVLSELPCDRSGEPDDRGLARRVRMGAQPARDPCGARRADDDARTLRHHDPGRVLHAEEHRTQQDGDGAVPVLDRGAADRTDGPEDAGVVEHAVEPAELCDGEIDRGRDRVLVGDVGLDEPRHVAELGGQPLRPRRPGGRPRPRARPPRRSASPCRRRCRSRRP